jgi:cbb3-type cytochrome oxidase subunit 3
MTLAGIGVNELAIFPELGLVLFFVVFTAVTVRALRHPQREMNSCANLPLDDATTSVDDTTQEPRGVS